MLRQTSLAMLGLIVGGSLTLIGFVAYFTDQATLNLAGFFYGIPLLLGGLALKAAELLPAPFIQPTSAAVLNLREQQATATQNQVRKDVTRYRYGQKAHLDSSLSFLGLSPMDEQRPVLVGVKEEETNGAYTLLLRFDSPQIPLDVWQQKQEKMTNYFGPGIRVEISQPEDEIIDLSLIATGEKGKG
ncbi:DUF2854 domain-containing protein [Kovacikia minuta CCNUW1]|uniref:DUF2854 domain-containing protein n=1 Tax=Kovacikia minuta TaxID=2931930 RepID=UPI001CCE2787|nr:DUF2854 domain-containing protein [Kovacikia minuta]UBF26905.1 DUF2854 domain-containing protein [Kovacikia minuta CCNUW1]